MITNKEIDKILEEYDVEEHYADHCSNCGEKISGQVILKKDVKKVIRGLRK